MHFDPNLTRLQARLDELEKRVDQLEREKRGDSTKIDRLERERRERDPYGGY